MVDHAAVKECDIRGPWPEEVDATVLRAGRAQLRRHRRRRQLRGLPPGHRRRRRRRPRVDADAAGRAARRPARRGRRRVRRRRRDADAGAVLDAAGARRAGGRHRHRLAQPAALERAQGDERAAAAHAGGGRGARRRAAAEARSGAAARDRQRRRLLRRRAHRAVRRAPGCPASRSSSIPVAAACPAWRRARFRELGASVDALHDELDPAFRQRHPDCAVPKHLTELAARVPAVGAAMGVAFDGDGDRLAVIDDRGRYVPAEKVAMLLVDGPLAVRPGRRRGARHQGVDAARARRRSGAAAVPVRMKSGHAYMKRAVIERGAVLGSEVSGHLFFGALSGIDDPLHAALALARWQAGGDVPLSARVDALPTFHLSPDLRLRIADAEIDALLDSLPARFPDADGRAHRRRAPRLAGRLAARAPLDHRGRLHAALRGRGRRRAGDDQAALRRRLSGARRGARRRDGEVLNAVARQCASALAELLGVPVQQLADGRGRQAADRASPRAARSSTSAWQRSISSAAAGARAATSTPAPGRAGRRARCRCARDGPRRRRAARRCRRRRRPRRRGTPRGRDRARPAAPWRGTPRRSPARGRPGRPAGR